MIRDLFPLSKQCSPGSNYRVLHKAVCDAAGVETFLYLALVMCPTFAKIEKGYDGLTSA